MFKIKIYERYMTLCLSLRSPRRAYCNTHRYGGKHRHFRHKHSSQPWTGQLA